MELTEKVYSKNYEQELEYVKYPVSISGSEHSYAKLSEPPALGQHTDEILSEILGYSSERIAELRSQKIV